MAFVRHSPPPTYKRGSRTYWSETFASYNSIAGGEHIPSRFFSPEIEKYFPSGTAFKGFAAHYLPPGTTTGGTPINEPEWIPVYGDTKNNTHSLIGRYAFFMMNTSDLLDISAVGKADRMMGYDPGEIQISEDLFPNEVEDAEALMDGLRDAGRYESFAEFNALHKDGSVVKDVRSLTTFSYEPANTNKIMIGGSADDLREKKVDIIRAFEECGLTAGEDISVKDGSKTHTFKEQAVWAYLGLIDFVDDDDEMEEDDDITLGGETLHPWERPATENMPLMSGFMANVKIERRERVLYDEDEDEYYKDPDNCDMKVSAEFKVPFVYPFLNDGPPVYTLFGKARIAQGPNAGANKDFCKKDTEGHYLIDDADYDESDDDLSGDDECVIDGLKVGNFDKDDKGWWVIPNVKSGNTKIPHPINGLRFNVQAAGGTAHKAGSKYKFQHRFPLDEDWFADPEEEPDSWMTIPFDTARLGIEFDNKKPTDEDEEHGVEFKYWCTNVVVWAEFIDPRFSCQYMAGNAAADFENMFMFYRPSHSSDDYVDEGTYYTVPVTEVRRWGEDEGNDFEDFTAADGVTVQKEFKKNAGYGDYFGGGAARNSGTSVMQGAGPLASFVLTHPSVVMDTLDMNIDGIRLDTSEGKNTTDTASKKWRAHVKNGPLESVGELGYLPIGIWHTIRLYDYNNKSSIRKTNNSITKYNHIPSDDKANEPPYHRVLDKFSVREDRISGRINLGTLNSNVLASAFYFMPIGTEQGSSLYPSPKKPKYRITALDARNLLARALMDCAVKDGIEKLSDFGNIFRYGQNDSTKNNQGKLYGLSGSIKGLAASAVSAAANGDSAMGEFEREAVIRNACGLFTDRGQTFIIAARGESYSPVFGKTSVEGGSINASKTAVAQVWRDSVTNEWGRHPVVIQFFKIIDD